MAGRHGHYLYKRRDSVNWYLRLVYPPELHGKEGFEKKRLEKCLGTPDRDEALVIALPQIQRHKQTLLMVRSLYRKGGRETVPNPLYDAGSDRAFRFEPGREHINSDGSRVIATPEQVLHLDAGGRITKTEPNVFTSEVVIKSHTVWDCSPKQALAMGMTPERVATMTFKKQPPKPKAEPDPDLKLLQDFLDLQTRTKHYENDARNTWKRWKAFIGDKPLSKCTRDDGRAFVKHLRAQDPPPAPVTLRKWVSLLKAPIAHGLPQHDPRQDIFHRLIGKVSRQTIRIPLTEAEMALFREKALPEQGSEETRLWAMMAMTGMRPSECTAVREEFEEGGIRYLMIGVGDKQAKSPTSIRRVPIPDALMPFLPDKIVGPLFTKGEVRLGANLLRAIRRIGITDKRKVVYSLRHRAHDRMRGVRCPPDIQREIVGHDIETVHHHYGVGSPMWMLKEWIEHIGW